MTPLVEEALKSLTAMVNLSTGIYPGHNAIQPIYT